MNNKLSVLQQDVLREFFARENRFFLTGGAALVGFHLGHRETHDLDLFTLADAIELGDDLTPPGGVSVAELRNYLTELIDRLTKKAFPESETTVD